MKQIEEWLVANGFKLRGARDNVEWHAGPGVDVEARRPSRLGRGPYLVRVTEDAVYESHIFDNGVTGLLYQPWVDIAAHPYATQDELKAILVKLTTPPKTCWNTPPTDVSKPAIATR